MKLKYSICIAEQVSVFVDADYAGDKIDRKSTSGTVVKLFGNVIDWSVKKQTATATSSAEAEYIALSAAAKSACAWKNFLESTGIRAETIPIFCDSLAAISIATTMETKRTRHIDVSYHHVRDLVKEEVISIRKVSSVEQIADICLCTKARAEKDW